MNACAYARFRINLTVDGIVQIYNPNVSGLAVRVPDIESDRRDEHLRFDPTTRRQVHVLRDGESNIHTYTEHTYIHTNNLIRYC